MGQAVVPHVAGFRILRRLGEGASAAVYHAIQEDSEREVALKVFEPMEEPDAVDPADIERERGLAAALRHRNLARILAMGEYGERRWLATEYLPGGTLAERIAARMRPADVLQVVRDLAQGLGHAHAQGIVHGDVKPANVLFRNAGEAVLVDFGSAAFAGKGSARLQGGTPGYMSPEQAAGEPVDGRSDLYGLGVVLHEMLTGRLPRPPDEPGAELRRPAPVPPLPVRHRWLQPLLDALLAERPEDRPADARALLHLLSSLCAASPEAQALLPIAAEEVARARVHGRHESVRERQRRRRRWILLAATALALVLVGVLLDRLL